MKMDRGHWSNFFEGHPGIFNDHRVSQPRFNVSSFLSLECFTFSLFNILSYLNWSMLPESPKHRPFQIYNAVFTCSSIFGCIRTWEQTGNCFWIDSECHEMLSMRQEVLETRAINVFPPRCTVICLYNGNLCLKTLNRKHVLSLFLFLLLLSSHLLCRPVQ